jgi:thiamine biosynthesis lipoprotein
MRIFTAVVAGALAVLPGCRQSAAPVQESWPAMGTFASIMMPAGERAHLAGNAGMARQTLQALEKQLSIFVPESEVSQLNRDGAVRPVALSPKVFKLLQDACAYSRLTGGAFDFTVAPLMERWGFRGGKPPEAPLSDQELKEVLEKVGWQHLVFGDNTVQFDRPGVRIDLGGIAKGYAVDQCYEQLVAAGTGSLMVNLGGNIRCGGLAAPGRPWRVAVRDPFQKDHTLGTIALGDGWALATSGHYEQFVMIRGERYAHIMDPVGGRPVKGMAGVTILAPTAMEADALSTSLFVLGPERGLAVLRKTRSEALWVTDGTPPEFLATPGFMARFKLTARVPGGIRVVDK